MIEYGIFTFSEIWPFAKELVAKQWEEVDHRRKTSKLNVVEDFYKTAEEAGIHFIVAAIDGDKVAGYISLFYQDSPHTGTLHVVTDTVYVNSEYRHSGVGKEMIKIAEEEAKRIGAEHFMITFKNEYDHSSIVEDLGFFSYQTIYSKALVDKKEEE